MLKEAEAGGSRVRGQPGLHIFFSPPLAPHHPPRSSQNQQNSHTLTASNTPHPQQQHQPQQPLYTHCHNTKHTLARSLARLRSWTPPLLHPARLRDTAHSTRVLACPHSPDPSLTQSLTHSLTHSLIHPPSALSPSPSSPRLPPAIAPPDSNPDTCKTTHKHAFLSPHPARHLFHLSFLASGSIAPNFTKEPEIVCVFAGGGVVGVGVRGGGTWCSCCWWSGVLRDHPDHPNGLFGPVLAPFGTATPLALAFASLGGFPVNPRSLILLLKPSQS